MTRGLGGTPHTGNGARLGTSYEWMRPEASRQRMRQHQRRATLIAALAAIITLAAIAAAHWL